MRNHSDYIKLIKSYVDMGQVPPDSIQFSEQQKALELEGFSHNNADVLNYRNIVRQMSPELRKEIFFLRVNDEMFRPQIDPVVKNLSEIDLYDLNF